MFLHVSQYQNKRAFLVKPVPSAVESPVVVLYPSVQALDCFQALEDSKVSLHKLFSQQAQMIFDRAPSGLQVKLVGQSCECRHETNSNVLYRKALVGVSTEDKSFAVQDIEICPRCRSGGIFFCQTFPYVLSLLRFIASSTLRQLQLGKHSVGALCRHSKTSCARSSFATKSFPFCKNSSGKEISD